MLLSKEITLIKRLKELFDTGSAELHHDYWDEELLQIYCDTLGERIRWKWQHFLNELKLQKIHPNLLFPEQSLAITDWGCGPGTASLAFAESNMSDMLNSFSFEDRSQVAIHFAQKRLKEWNSKEDTQANAPKALLISYVLSELPKDEETKLIEKIFNFDLFLWVDAGTHTESRKLGEIRNTLLSHFDFYSPCPHSLKCPLSGDTNPNDWCHRFAKPPQEVFHSAYWSEISKLLKIDLRSLPYSSLMGIKKKHQITHSPQATRLGRPRVFKHEIVLDHCNPDGSYSHDKVSKREHPALFKKLRKE
ncbi:MAG: small ribosomal subunit Rsm22 family protein [Bdellovibrionota bacterium]